MPLRSVIFDFGIVLTGTPLQHEHDAMVRLTGLTPQQFEPLYWADRHAYDEGKLTGITFWQKFLADAAIPATPALVEQLNAHDARMWTTENPRMLAWQLALAQRGLKTAILSNMGDAVLASIESAFPWLSRFDVLVWSYQLGIAKPDPAIYLHTLEKLGTAPAETLFIDDKLVNVHAAQALGIQAIEYTTVENLRTQLTALGLADQIPLPA
ncbi:MAG TPA: HAD family phosphatase [Terracidiphilus sp.]